MKIGDIKEKTTFIFLRRWLVCKEVKKNYQRFQEFLSYENAIIFSELIKQRFASNVKEEGK